MTAKLRSKSPRPSANLRLAYSAPGPEVPVIENVHRYTLPATKSLAFVKLSAHDQPMWRPESYWHVTSTGKRALDLRLGRKYAQAAIAAMKADCNTHLVACILQDMLSDAIKGAYNKGRNSNRAVMRGFLAEISESLGKVS
jgi:hypothetical protein